MNIKLQEFHLTSSGWIEGSYKSIPLEKSEIRRVPMGRVLTVHYYDNELSDSIKCNSTVQVIWESDNKKLITNLKKKYGDNPNSIF